MGTNFYLRGHGHDNDPQWHLGKRSAAGLYCWDCQETLCLPGKAFVHLADDSDWLRVCPTCGAVPTLEELSESSAGRELGFNRAAPAAKTGVRSCSSFTWAMDPARLPMAVEGLDRSGDRPECVIEDEYGRLYTMEEFQAVLLECPITFLDRVGRRFS